MKNVILTKAVLLAGALMLFAGCVVYEAPPGPLPAPPVPRADVVPPQPDVTFIWTPGFWDWRGRWVWTGGYWAQRPHPGAVWVQGGWVERGGRHVWIHPHWE